MPAIVANLGAAIAESAGRLFRTMQQVVHLIGLAHSARPDCAWFLNCDGVMLRAFAKARVKEGTEL